MIKQRPAGALEAVLLAILLLATTIAFYSSINQTKWYLDDKDLLSYVGVVLLMLALQVVFFNTKLEAKPDSIGFAIAFLFYIAAAAVFIYAPASMSLNFWFYRFDFLALALFFSASCFLLFGSSAAQQMAFTIIYAFLSWPVLFLPITEIEPFLTSFTGDVVHILTTVLGMAITREPGNIFVSLTTEIPVIIAPECVALSAILGFIAFMLPLAYFLEGRANRKFAWLVGCVLLLLALNVIRIMAVILVWNYQGITNALTLFHSTSGNVMFNGAVLLSLISFPFFGLSIPRLRGTSLFSGRFRSVLDDTWEDLLMAPSTILLSIFCLGVAVYAFSSLDGVVKDYAWLSEFEGEEFHALQATHADIPVPESWNFLASETGFSDEFVVTRIIYEEPTGEQIQVVIYSSGNRSTLWFSAEDKLTEEGFVVTNVENVAIAQGIASKLISYERTGRFYTSIYWAQPARFGNHFTYVVIIFTVGDDATHSHKQHLIDIAREFKNYF